MSASTASALPTLTAPDAARHPGPPALCSPGHAAPARLTTTVPKEYVHRAAIAEVLLTDWVRTADDHFTVTAQWPRLHAYFATADGYHDPLIAAETIRQAGLLLAHAAYDVPLGHHFVMWDLAVDLAPDHLRLRPQPAAVTLQITCQDIKYRGGRLAGMRLALTLHRDGRPAGTAAATLTCVTPAVYRRLRAPHTDGGHPEPRPLPAPVPPHLVGRHHPGDVVLAPTTRPRRWELRADTSHPVLFDHPVDHVPGMVLLEAARQAALADHGRAGLPTTITSEYLRYAELDTPCYVEALALPTTTGDTADLLITAHQNDAPVFVATLTLTTPNP
ncbi:ScbA/BarX family gamma-butyrolactone biosynthesis protein [Streptomyces broussonetiae]|uniref:ScbA/BarX family gamma-butyrolactone biosynthesis protein n=1 Tax=Streptomyces broussonetiae TaxID=2686304 RepID=A0ABV5EM22_9ACTN